MRKNEEQIKKIEKLIMFMTPVIVFHVHILSHWSCHIIHVSMMHLQYGLERKSHPVYVFLLMIIHFESFVNVF